MLLCTKKIVDETTIVSRFICLIFHKKNKFLINELNSKRKIPKSGLHPISPTCIYITMLVELKNLV
jgi:hypothetical protein